jgi:integrase-like protein
MPFAVDSTRLFASPKPLAARTVGHAYRVLHRALERGVEAETLARNVAGVIGPPKVEDAEVEILQPDELATLLAGLAGHDLNMLAHTAVGTGMRRGELLALAWPCVDLDKAKVRVERSLEETEAGLRFKPPKNRNSRRTISLPASVIPLLREHRKAQLELRMQLGLGKPPADALVFCKRDGEPLSPDDLSWRWRHLPRQQATDGQLPRAAAHPRLGADRRRHRRGENLQAPRPLQPDCDPADIRPPLRARRRRGGCGDRCGDAVASAPIRCHFPALFLLRCCLSC